jgi:tetratricopeptide (TPR) repeat protein
MKNSGLFGNAALAAVFVLPAVAWQGASAGSIEEALRRTLAALEALTGIEQSVQSGAPGAIDSVLSATERALPPEARSDDDLLALRGELQRLERELDGLTAPSAEQQPGQQAVEPAAEPNAAANEEPEPAPILTTGLDEGTRQMLAALTPGAPAGLQPKAATVAIAADSLPQQSDKLAFEAPGYAADVLRLARAYYKQGRWSDALGLLDKPGTPEETYWRARCLEKLGRDEEAVKAYEQVAADPAGGSDAQRAREDLEFLRWRMEFAVRQKSAVQKGQG